MSEIKIPDWALKAIDERYENYDQSSAAIFGACIIIECLEKTRAHDLKVGRIQKLLHGTVQAFNLGRESIRRAIQDG